MNLNRKKRLLILACTVGCLLLIPLMAMQFTEEVDWSPGDFVFAGGLLFATGLTYELIASRSASISYRVAFGIAVMAGLMLIWVNGAVGIIGDEGNPANLLYVGVLQVGVIGSALARLRPRGLAYTAYVTAAAQALVPVIALFLWRSSLNEPPGIVGVFVLNGFFVTLFVVSGSLFQNASAMAQGAER